MSKQKIIVMILIAMFSVGISLTSWRMSHLETLREQGPAAAVAQGDAEIYLQDRDFKALFGLAWSLYAKGELSKADALVTKMLYQEDWTLDDKIKANCYYLKGILSRKRNDRPEAISSYFRAKDLYRRLSEPRNVYKVNLDSAKLYLDMGDLNVTRAILDESYQTAMEHDLSLIMYYYVESQLSFHQGDYGQAFHYAELSYQEALNDANISEYGNSLSDLGFYAMLSGRWNEGLDYTLEAQAYISQTGDEDLYHYNLINFLFYRRCMGISPHGDDGSNRSNKLADPLVPQIRNWIETQRDQHLQWYLEFTLNYNCDDIEIVPGISTGPSSPPD